jgi:hypothetical protein
MDAHSELVSRPLMSLSPTLEAAHQIGPGPWGVRNTVPVTGGTFSGPALSGRILPGGSDCAITRRDGVLELDVRLTLETTDGALIHTTYTGLRHGPAEVLARLGRQRVDPAEYYFRIVPRFETAAPAYEWLNRLIAVGLGDRRPDGPVYTIFEIL